MAKKQNNKTNSKTATPSKKVLDAVVKRAHYLANQMIYMANHRKDKAKGDPKVGGHSSGSSSAIHITGALHLLVKTGFDHIANKPHASPADHAYTYLLDNLLNKDNSKLTDDEKNTAMAGLRAFSQNGEHVFQSYHSAHDPDRHNFFPSGTVGIPPVNAGYLALAYRFTKDHGYKTPDAHFWAIVGDSEFREGSLFEAVPDFAERELGNLTWIVDYNRQSLDGHRITNQEVMNGTDAHRIERTMDANGWEVIQVQHGKLRQAAFKTTGGKELQNWLDNELTDYELQSLLLVKTPKELATHLKKNHDSISSYIKSEKPEAIFAMLRDFGGHDIIALQEAMENSKKSTDRPTIIIAHTLKGWGLDMAAQQGNHSSLPTNDEMLELRLNSGLIEETLFGGFDKKTEEGQFLNERGNKIYSEIKEQHAIKDENEKTFAEKSEWPTSLNINLKMASYPHTQWMLGQLTSKFTRIANTPLNEKDLTDGLKPLTEDEKFWKTQAELFVSMAPDVGTSTNLNPSMDGKIFGAIETEDFETEFDVKNKKLPDLIPGEDNSDRFLRFEIAEANVMSCVGSFGKIKDLLGIPLLPLMTVYDFFIKRAHDQYFYDLYWNSSFICAGTPAGVTLSPEGAQHGWKSDFQIPGQVTWEPFFCQELDWIFCDSVRRHYTDDNVDRNGVLLRGVTRGIDQKAFLKYLKQQKRFKTSDELLSNKLYPLANSTPENEVATMPNDEIMEAIRLDVLEGGYSLINYEGYANYEPGDNVVNIFAMGAMGTEAIEASQQLLAEGIYANVIMITSPDLLIGNLGEKNNYEHLKNNLGINSNLYLQPQFNGSLNHTDLLTVSGRRIPIVSVHDGEPGLLDNIGSIVGLKHKSLAVRKHSKCGRPVDIYKYHGIDADSVIKASKEVLAETALEEVKVSQDLLMNINSQSSQRHTKAELLPEMQK